MTRDYPEEGYTLDELFKWPEGYHRANRLSLQTACAVLDTPQYVGLDPGGTTGIAILCNDMSIATCESTDEAELWDFLSRVQPRFVVYEDFLWQERHSVDFAPLRMIGIIHLYLQTALFDVGRYVQSPAEGKGFWNDDKLTRADCYTTGSPHERDATRHLLHYLSFKKHDHTWLKLLKEST